MARRELTPCARRSAQLPARRTGVSTRFPPVYLESAVRLAARTGMTTTPASMQKCLHLLIVQRKGAHACPCWFPPRTTSLAYADGMGAYAQNLGLMKVLVQVLGFEV